MTETTLNADDRLRQWARTLIDKAWNECTESGTVPSTDWADRIIDSVPLPAPATEPSEVPREGKELPDGMAYLRRLFLIFAPQCTPMDDLPGLVSQIDNLLAGMRDDLLTAESKLTTYRERCTCGCAPVDAAENRLAEVTMERDHYKHSFDTIMRFARRNPGPDSDKVLAAAEMCTNCTQTEGLPKSTIYPTPDACPPSLSPPTASHAAVRCFKDEFDCIIAFSADGKAVREFYPTTLRWRHHSMFDLADAVELTTELHYAAVLAELESSWPEGAAELRRLEGEQGARRAPGCRCTYCLDQLPPDDYPVRHSRRIMVVCEHCGNKRCPHATHHIHACTGSNEPGQKGSAWENHSTQAAGGDSGASLKSATDVSQDAPLAVSSIERAVRSINQLAAEELGRVFGMQADKKLAEIIREAIEGKAAPHA